MGVMAAKPALAQRLQRLASTMVPAGASPQTPREIAEATGLSPSYVGHLMNGTRENPSQKVIAVLARHFGVPVGYFFDEDDTFARVADQLDKLDLYKVLTRKPALQIATRLGDLSDVDLEAVAGIVERFADRHRGPR